MKVCDIDNSSEDIEDVALGVPREGSPAAMLTAFDCCKPCRDALEHGGIEALVERYEQSRGRRRKRKSDEG